MIGNQLIRELVETVILSGKLKDTRPISLLLIATPESGKTSVVLERPCKAIKAFSDLTGKGIQLVLQQKPEITHIIINDMVAVLSHRQNVNKFTMSVLNAMTEEGFMSSATPSGIEDFQGGQKGIITSLTTDLVADERNWWNKIGFVSRMLPFCYSYPEELIIAIKNGIDEGSKEKQPKDFIPPASLKIVKYSQEFVAKVRRIADIRSQILEEVGIRRLKQYHTMVQSHALLRNYGSPEVNQSDVDFLSEIDLFVTYHLPRKLDFHGINQEMKVGA
jgi:hypothetical protein